MFDDSLKETIITRRNLKKAEDVCSHTRNFASRERCLRISEIGIDVDDLNIDDAKEKLSTDDLSKDKLSNILNQSDGDIERVFALRKNRKNALSQLQQERIDIKEKLFRFKSRAFEVEGKIENKEYQCDQLRNLIDEDSNNAFGYLFKFFLSIVFWVFAPVFAILILRKASDKSSSWINAVAMLRATMKSFEDVSLNRKKLIGIQQEIQLIKSQKNSLISEANARYRRTIKKDLDELQKNKIIDAEKEWKQRINQAVERASISVCQVFAYKELIEEHYQTSLAAFLQSIDCLYNDYLNQKAEINESTLLNECQLPNYAERAFSSWKRTNYWKSASVNGYKPVSGGSILHHIRIGQLCNVSLNKEISLDLRNPYSQILSYKDLSPKATDMERFENFPFILDNVQKTSTSCFHQSGHVAIFSNSSETRKAALDAIEAFSLRSFVSFPVRKLKGIFIDPINMGNSFPFKDLPEEISGKRVFTTGVDIQEELAKLISHTEQVIQTYLSRNFDSIAEYNAVDGAIQEAYRYLFIADFPNKFDNRALEYLNSLLINGAKAGVYAIVHIDETIEHPKNFNYDLFKNQCQVLRPIGKTSEGKPLFAYESADGLCYETALDCPPDKDTFNYLTTLLSEACSKVRIKTIDSSSLHPAVLWTEDSRKEIRTPIGVSGARDRLEFWLGQNSKGYEVSQCLLVGKPGAGKSYTLHSVINGLAMRYSPDELELYLLDYKEGVEFQIYVDPERSEKGNSGNLLNTERALPHAKVISIESDREFGLSVLRKIQEEFKRRADEWKSIANNVTKVAEFRNKTEGKMPRILVVIDEFQVLFEEDDAISREINKIFTNIVKQGRAFGIHLLLASQAPNIQNISRGIFNLLDLRMAMQMNQNVAAMTLAEGNTDAIELLDRPGKIIYNSDFGRKGSNQIGQVADLHPQARIESLRKIQETAQARNHSRSVSEPLVLFDGRHPTRLEDNGLLAKLAQAPAWLQPSEIKSLISAANWRSRQQPSVAWLGEAMRIGHHSRAIFRRESGSNLLLVGKDAENMYGILGGLLTSLACCHQPEKANFCIVDLADEEEASLYWSDMTLAFRETFNDFYPIELAKDFPDKARRIRKTSQVLSAVFKEFESRHQQRQANPDELDLGPTTFFVCAFGTLECLNSFRPVPGKRGDLVPSEESEKLMTIVKQGPDLGIHVVLWLESTEVIKQLCAGREKQLVNAFNLRVCSAIPTNESQLLLGDNTAAKLPELRAYFKDMTRAGHLEKFKPYAVPSSKSLQRYNQWLAKKLYQR